MTSGSPKLLDQVRGSLPERLVDQAGQTRLFVSAGRQDGIDRKGLAAAIASYVLWGVFPLYGVLLKHVPSLQTVAHSDESSSRKTP